MKTNSISKKFISALLMISLFVLFSTPLMAADSYFEKGKKYRIGNHGQHSDVLVLSKPDDFGWMKVKVLRGFIAKMGFDEGLVNIMEFLVATEITIEIK